MRYSNKYTLKIFTPLVILLSITIWMYYFSVLPAQLGFIKIPQVRFERCLRQNESSIRVLISSETRLEDFNGTSYLRILGSKESLMDSYTDCFIGDRLRENILLESSIFSFSYMYKNRYYYEVSFFGHGDYDETYLRVFYIKAFGYIYGSNLIVLKSEQ